MFFKNKKFQLAAFCLLMFLLAWPAGLLVQTILTAISFLIGWIVWFYHPKDERGVEVKNYWLILPVAILLLSRFLPFMLYGPHPLGYDTGFYHYNIEKERQALQEKKSVGLLVPVGNSQLTKDQNILSSLDYKKLNLTMVESLGSRWITKLLIGLGLSNWMILYGFFILMELLIGILVYLLARLYFDKNVAFFSALIYSLSFVQFLGFWQMFWKNAIGLVLLLLVFYLLEKQNKIGYWLSVPAIALIFFTHKTSAFLLFVCLVVYFLISKNRYRIYLLLVLLIAAASFAWLNKGLVIYLWEQIVSGFTAYYDFFAIREGNFIGWNEFVNHSLLYLPFGALGIFYMLKEKKITLGVILALVSGFLILIKFVFYQRITLYLDIALLILVGWGIYQLAKKLWPTSLGKALIVIFAIFWSMLFFVKIITQESAISQREFQNIEAIKNIEPKIKIFTADSYYAAWLYGFSGHEVLAPGLQDKKWVLERWRDFWNSDLEVKKTMLKEFSQPLLVYQDSGSTVDFDEDKECFKKVSEQFYLFKCYK